MPLTPALLTQKVKNAEDQAAVDALRREIQKLSAAADRSKVAAESAGKQTALSLQELEKRRKGLQEMQDKADALEKQCRTFSSTIDASKVTKASLDKALGIVSGECDALALQLDEVEHEKEGVLRQLQASQAAETRLAREVADMKRRSEEQKTDMEQKSLSFAEEMECVRREQDEASLRLAGIIDIKTGIVSEREAEIERQRAARTLATEQLDTLEKRCELHLQQVQHTTRKLEAREVDLTRVFAALHRESSALQSQTSRAQELQDELALMSSQLEAIRTRNIGLHQAIQGDMSAKEGLRASLDEANFTNHEMVRQMSELKDNGERLDRQLQDAQAQARHSEKELDEQRANSASHAQRASSNICTLEKDLDSSKEQLLESAATNQALQRDLDHASDSLEQLQTQVSQLTSLLENERDKAEREHGRRLAGLQSALDESSASLSKVEHDLDALKRQAAKVFADLERTQRGLDAANGHKAQAQQDLEVIRSNFFEAEEQAKDSEKAVRSLTTQLDAEKIRSQSLSKALEDANCDCNTLTANVKVIEETVANLTRQQQALSATESRLQRQLDDAARSKEQLQHEIAQMRVNSDRELLSATEKIQELESELCIRQEQLKLDQNCWMSVSTARWMPRLALSKRSLTHKEGWTQRNASTHGLTKHTRSKRRSSCVI